MKKFVILTTQRSGSTWLVDILNSVKGVVASSELFLTKYKMYASRAGEKYPTWLHWYQNKKNIAQLKFRPAYIKLYLNEFYADGNEVHAKGFKLMYSHLKVYPEIFFYLIYNRIKILHLIRENSLDVYLSKLRVRTTKVAHSNENSGNVILKVSISKMFRELRSHQRAVNVAMRIFSRIGCPYDEVIYENILGSEKSIERVICDLGLKEENINNVSKLKKLRTQSYKKEIENYSEVANALKRTKYAKYLKGI